MKKLINRNSYLAFAKLTCEYTYIAPKPTNFASSIVGNKIPFAYGVSNQSAFSFLVHQTCDCYYSTTVIVLVHRYEIMTRGSQRLETGQDAHHGNGMRTPIRLPQKESQYESEHTSVAQRNNKETELSKSGQDVAGLKDYVFFRPSSLCLMI